MSDSTPFHSRLDFELAPAPSGIWARLLRQMQLQLLLTFYPHPDSCFFPTRLRVLLAGLSIFFGTIFLGYYWWDVKKHIPHYPALLAVMLGFSFLVLVQVLWQPIPRLKNTLIFPVLLWFCLPVFFFLDYLFMAGRWPALEYLCVMLLLYSNLLYWRVAALGIATGFCVALFVFCALGGQLFHPAPLDVFGLAVVLAGGLSSSYTFGRADSQRYAQNARAVRIISKRLEMAFGVQLALSEALRHEARYSPDQASAQRLAEVVQRLDVRANLTRASLQEIEREVGQAPLFGIQLLQVERLCPAMQQELESAYGWPAQQLQRSLQCHDGQGLVLQGVWMETVQLLASVFALMLRHASRPEQAEQGGTLVAVQWDQTHSRVRLSIAQGSDPAAFAVLDATQGKRSEAEHMALAARLLPAYSLYVMKKMGARLQLHSTAGGQLHSLRISWPRPDLLQNRFTGYRPLSLMREYEEHLE